MSRYSYRDRKQTYINALIAFGDKNQMIVAVEELSECQKEVCKFLRGDGNSDHLAEEIADATIMLEQLCLFHGLTDMVEQKRDEKIARLERKLRKDE